MYVIIMFICCLKFAIISLQTLWNVKMVYTTVHKSALSYRVNLAVLVMMAMSFWKMEYLAKVEDYM